MRICFVGSVEFNSLSFLSKNCFWLNFGVSGNVCLIIFLLYYI